MHSGLPATRERFQRPIGLPGNSQNGQPEVASRADRTRRPGFGDRTDRLEVKKETMEGAGEQAVGTRLRP